MIDRALREAYQKHDRTEQVRKLLRGYVSGLVVVYRDRGRPEILSLFLYSRTRE